MRRRSPEPRLKVHDVQQDEHLCLLATGDAAAFRSLVREYYPLAYNLAKKTLSDQRDAEEVVQDAFVKIHQAIGDFRGEAALKTWILRIVLRLSLNRRRDRSRSAWRRLGLHHRDQERGDGGGQSFREEQLPSPEADPEGAYIARENRRIIMSLVDGLPEPLRQVLVLNSFDELSYEEIAAVLDIPVGTVGSRIYSGRKALMKQLRQRELL
ncbi:MAG: sigma-70 family RNA polymerase sigma factor [Candidatus Latescibacteria bacterium]|nr:sigma-70 family RNA polymerase sigma factor [Candidatus Latescibacterota bacterium]